MNGVETLASWFTPTVLFCVLNLMIGTIFIASSLKPPHSNEEQPPQLIRVPSLLERVKSFNISSYQTHRTDPVHEEEAPSHRKEEEAPHNEFAAVKKVLQKSASEKVVAEKEEVEEAELRRPATMRERAATGEDEAVDEKADDFINRFRQQLRLQRLDSLLRGAGK